MVNVDVKRTAEPSYVYTYLNTHMSFLIDFAIPNSSWNMLSLLTRSAPDVLQLDEPIGILAPLNSHTRQSAYHSCLMSPVLSLFHESGVTKILMLRSVATGVKFGPGGGELTAFRDPPHEPRGTQEEVGRPPWIKSCTDFLSMPA